MKFLSITLERLVSTMLLASAYPNRFEEYTGRESTTVELICSGANFTSVDKERLALFRQLKKLIIKDTSLEGIPEGLSELPYLEEFEFSSNRFAYDFDNLKDLERLPRLAVLNLQGNMLRNIPASVTNLTGLTSASFACNLIKEVPRDFDKLQNLVYLDLSHNKIDRLPVSFGNLLRLKSVDLSFNNLMSLPFEFAKLQNLEILNLSANSFNMLPIATCVLNRLSEISFHSNNLLTLQLDKNDKDRFLMQYLEFRGISRESFISRCCAHIERNAYRNRLLEAQSLSYETCLEALDFKMTSFRHGIFNLSNLLRLCLTSNQIHMIPKDIERLDRLQCLYLSNNFIQELPKEIVSLRKLINLYLEDNKITSLPVEFNRFRSCRLNLGSERNHFLRLENTTRGMGQLATEDLNLKKLNIQKQAMNKAAISSN